MDLSKNVFGLKPKWCSITRVFSNWCDYFHFSSFWVCAKQSFKSCFIPTHSLPTHPSEESLNQVLLHHSHASTNIFHKTRFTPPSPDLLSHLPKQVLRAIPKGTRGALILGATIEEADLWIFANKLLKLNCNICIKKRY